MESTALSLGKSVLDGALGYAKSALAEEVALQLGIQRDHAFIRDELEMMQAFLMVAHEERDQHKVLKTWVKQVRDVAYDAEDYLQEFSIHLKRPSWWRLPCTLRERRRIATKMKELRARVEDVSQRNLRYQLIKNTSSRPGTADELSSITAATIFGIDEARLAAKHDKSKGDLVDLINKEGEDLRVIAVWGTSGDLGMASIVNAAYENPSIKKKFSCRAWARVMHPFNPSDFVHSLVKQFRSAEGVDILLETEKTGQELAEEFSRHVNERSYLIVINDLSTFEEWNGIKICFPNNMKGSRIILCTRQVEVASLCAGQESLVVELKQLSVDQTIYAFYEKDRTNLLMSMSSSNEATTSTNNNSMVPTDAIRRNLSKGGDGREIPKSITRIKTSASALEESQLIGREREKSDIVKLISNQPNLKPSVISVWGMGGLGKTTLVKDVYQSQNLSGMFEKRACVTVMRPFILKDLLKSLVMQIYAGPLERKGPFDYGQGTRNTLAVMEVHGLVKELAIHLEGKKCFIVFDDLSSTSEWDQIIWSLPKKLENSSRIVVTTRKESIAKYCSEKQENIYKLDVLQYKDALDLFTRKVFKVGTDFYKYPELTEETKQILKKCNGLPLAIVTIGGFLAKQPKTAIEWRKLNEHISSELEMNPELEAIRTILGKSYEGLPYHLKSCFLYMSVFPEDQKISRRRLIQRWTAEGYSREIRDKSAEVMADSYFTELIQRSMIMPSQQSIYSRKGIDACQVHDLMREISISKSAAENLVFRMVEGCSSNTQEIVRHLAIDSSWKGDKRGYESIVDLSRVRSLTIFGMWRSFYISDKMRLLRVLDLEGTLGLHDHGLVHIGKLLHLKYLSLRGCHFVFHLPDSLGNLRQLQTLDITDTNIAKLPDTITKLWKLRYLHCGKINFGDVTFLERTAVAGRSKLWVLTLFSVGFCVMCCAPQIFAKELKVKQNRHSICTMWCCFVFPHAVGLVTPGCVVVPRGIWKMKALQRLGIVNLERGKVVLQEIRRLTNLRKLGVAGVNMKNSKEFCLALADLCNLESLLVWSIGKPGLQGCLDGLSSPPKNLQSLKLYGNLVKLPEWIQGLHDLVKLALRSSRILEHDAAMHVLGELPNLTIMRLLQNSFQGAELCLSFPLKAFPSLTVLEMDFCGNIKSVKFEERASTDIEETTSPEIEIEERASTELEGASCPKLELIQFRGWEDETNAGLFSGLASLLNLKEFLLQNNDVYKDDFLEDVQAQLAQNPSEPVLKRI